MINRLLYSSVVGTYAFGIRMFSLFNHKAKLFIDGRRGLMPKIQETLSNEHRKRVWIHCASLGEFEQGRPVLEEIRRHYPGHAIVLTFFSPSGYEVRKDYKEADYVFYLPVDNQQNATQFLDAVKPELCIFIKYELWYFYLSGLKERGIPTFLVSAVFTEKQGFFKWYGSLQREMLTCFSTIFVQNENSIKLLNSIGINNVALSGDTRFDRVVTAASEVIDLPIAASFCAGYKVIVAGSTWKEDEVLLQQSLSRFPADWRLIVVPHEVHNEHISEIERLFGGSVIKWSNWKAASTCRVLLVDKVGFLLQLYKYGTVAYVGGGFGKAGVHNVLEPAVYGLPCLFGPVYNQFLEAVELVGNGGAVVVNNTNEFIAAVNSLSIASAQEQKAKTAREYVLSKQGATAKVMQQVKEILG